MDEHEVKNSKRIKTEENANDKYEWVFIKTNGKYSCYLVKDNPIDTILLHTNLNEDQIATEDGIVWFGEEARVELTFEKIRKTRDFLTYYQRVKRKKQDSIFIVELCQSK
jgi:hypothetical protein